MIYPCLKVEQRVHARLNARMVYEPPLRLNIPPLGCELVIYKSSDTNARSILVNSASRITP
jgi:hypothetical protein